ncbi:MAG: hypothetical protein OTJ97_06855 [SAR202 cluster bacterium]|nr:hypothetical protein [SAR202 cluster bacterium]
MTKVTDLRILDDTILRMVGTGDNWHTTWAGDDKLYVSLNDGEGFPDVEGYTGMSLNTRVFAVNGHPPNHSSEYLPGFPDLPSGEIPEERSRYYGFSIIALDEHIYHYLYTPNHPWAWPPPHEPVGDDKMWFDAPIYLGFWVADQAWGPWSQVHEETSWTPAEEPGAREYQPQISPKWISDDGKSFWMIFTDSQPVDGERLYYDCNVQKVEILIE